MALAWVAFAACVATAFVVLARLSADGRDGYWRMAHLLLVPPTIVTAMFLSSLLDDRPLTVDEAMAQIDASSTVDPVSLAPTDTPLPLAPTPTATAIASDAALPVTPSATIATGVGGELSIGTTSMVNGDVHVPVNTGPARDPWLAFSLALVWDQTKFTFGGFEIESSLIAGGNPLCVPAAAGSTGGEVVSCLVTDRSSYASAGNLVVFKLTPTGLRDCTRLHLLQPGGADQGSATTASYTVNSADTTPQTNTFGADTGVDQSGAACVPAPPTNTPTATGTAVIVNTPVATATPTPTPPASATPTGSPTETVTVSPDPVATEVVIDARGGQISSPDGHATIEFPADALSTPLRIKVSAKPRSETPGVPGNSHLLTAWQFDARDINNGDAPVHQFNSNVTIHLRYSSEELFGLREDLIRYWVFDEATSEWQEQKVLPVKGAPYEWTVQLNHFSTQASSSDGIIKLPPVLDSAQVNTNTGASTFALPIKVAPGIGGLQPDVTLTYNSARVDDTTAGTSAPWVGVGWDLAMPAIARAGDKYFLNLGGSGNQLVKSAEYATDHRWLTKNQAFLDIVHDDACDDLESSGENLSDVCEWTVRDQAGRTYVFGAGTGRRYYFSATHCPSPSDNTLTGYHRYYQWDLTSATDLHNNTASYAYNQTRGWSFWCGSSAMHTVVSSYPSEVTYPGGKVTFALREAPLVADIGIITDSPTPGSYVMTRPDVPSCASGNCLYVPVVETRALASITTTNGLTQLAKYDFLVDSVGAEARLTSIGVAGAGSGSLNTIEFSYEGHTTSLFNWTLAAQSWACRATNDQRTASRLATIENGFGGAASFHYAEYHAVSQAACGHWNRWLADAKTTTAGFNTSTNPNVALSYVYEGEPVHDTDGNYRGYNTSKETDLALNVATRTYRTTGELAGRILSESITGGGTAPRSVSYGWVSTPVAGASGVSFNNLNTIATTTYGVTTTVVRDYDNTHGGILIETRSSGGLCQKTTNDYYYQSPSSTWYLLLPKSTKQLACGGSTSAPDAEMAYFYDGLSGAGTIMKGNLTASRSLADKELQSGSKNYAWTLASYDGTGRPLQVSVPIYGNASPPVTGPATGTVPATQGHTDVTYDATNPLLVTSETVYLCYPDCVSTSPVTQQVTYDYADALHRALGKPRTTTGPDQSVSGTDYDAFGRPISSWQSPSTAASPDTTKTYSWNGDTSGGVNFSTTYLGSMVAEVACFDGIGRATQTNVNRSDAIATAWQRTQAIYDGRGMQVNSRVFDDSMACAPTAIGNGETPSAPNNIVAYDALGNVTTTTTNDGASTPGNQSTTTTSHPIVIAGRITTRTVDQLGHMKESDADGLGRTIESREYTGSGGYSLYATTTFEYDILDRLTKVTDNANNVTLMTYDALGRKLTMKDPDMSGGNTPWVYEYDAAGNLTKQTDARGVITTMTYDSLNRLRTKHYVVPTALTFPAGEPAAIPAQQAVTFTYDAYDDDSICGSLPPTSAIGKLTVMTDGSGSTRWCYDIRGREIRKRRYIGDATPYDVQRAYDSWDRVTSTMYPGDSEQVFNLYDGNPGPSPVTLEGSVAGWGNASATQCTFSINPGLGSNRFLLVGVSIEDKSRSVTGITYGTAQALSWVATESNTGTNPSNTARTELWKLVAPATGEHTVTVSLSGASKVACGGTAWVNVNQAAPLGTVAAAHAESGSPSVSVSGVATGDVVHDTLAVAAPLNLVPTGPGQTTLWNKQIDVGDNNSLTGAASSVSGASGTVQMSWAGTVGNAYALLAVPIKRAAAPAPLPGAGHIASMTSSLGNSIFNGTRFEHPNGGPTSMVLGNGATTSYGFDPLYRLGSIATTIGASTRQSLAYTYYATNNIHTIADTPGAETLSYTYDDLDRLTSMTINAAPTPQAAYGYAGLPGTIGNLTGKQEGSANLSLAYPASGSTPTQPHGAQSIIGTQKRWFTLDKNGNQIGSGSDEYIFDVENRLVGVYGAMVTSLPLGTAKCMDFGHDGTISILDLSYMASKFTFVRSNPAWDFRVDLDGDGAISILDLSAEANFSSLPTTCWAQRTNYLYDGLGNLVKRTSTDVSTAPYTVTSVTYIDGIFEKTNGGAVTKYYGAFGRNLAVRDVPGGTGAGTLSYLLSDHLGSTVGALDAAGNSLGTQSYWPFGAARSQTGAVETDKLYTSQQRESLTTTQTPLQGATDALGTYFYHARFYSTVTGRFASADSLAVDGLNRYAYVVNNPVNYTDPSGLCVGGPKAPCNPQIALDLLACAQSVEGCAHVFQAHELPGSAKDIAAAHAFAWAAVGTPEFFENFFRADINPYFNGGALLGAYRSGFDPISGLFPYANLTFEKYFPSNGSQLLDAALAWLADPNQVSQAVIAVSSSAVTYLCKSPNYGCAAAAVVYLAAVTWKIGQSDDLDILIPPAPFGPSLPWWQKTPLTWVLNWLLDQAGKLDPR